MDDFPDFETVFGSNPNIAYSKTTRESILRHRQILENELFIDRLLKALGIRKGMLTLYALSILVVYESDSKVVPVSRAYPPESNHDLTSLYEHIISSSSPDHYKHSVIYYLVKDLADLINDGPEDFARASYLPGKYKIFVNGIWHLDRLEIEVKHDVLSQVFACQLAPLILL